MAFDHASEEDGSITHFFRLARAGESVGAEELWKRYLPRLFGLARKTLGNNRHLASEPDDILQSVFFSFWQQAQVGDFSDWQKRNEIWSLLAKLTVRKVHQNVRREQTIKRGGGNVRNETEIPHSGDREFRLDEAAITLPSAEFDLCCEEYLAALDDDTRSVVLLKMMGHSSGEVEKLLGFSESKVTRKLRIARKTWSADENLSPDSEKSGGDVTGSRSKPS